MFGLHYIFSQPSEMCALQRARVEKIQELFPFTRFFENAPQPVFKGRTFEEDFDIAEGCFRHVKKIFTQLEVTRTILSH